MTAAKAPGSLIVYAQDVPTTNHPPPELEAFPKDASDDHYADDKEQSGEVVTHGAPSPKISGSGPLPPGRRVR